MSESKTVILNGNKLWLGVIAFLIVHGGTGIFWAGKLDTTVKLGLKNVEDRIQVLTDVVSENKKEVVFKK